MPGWSPEIANEFIRLGQAQGRAFDQMQLQKLVYVAHGWCLAFSAEPLTGDRPEAWSFGPVYRRLADCLAPYGRQLVSREIVARPADEWSAAAGAEAVKAELDSFETDTILMVFKDYSHFNAPTLAALTQSEGTPWEQVFAGGAGEFWDIPHQLIRAQFLEFARSAEVTRRGS